MLKVDGANTRLPHTRGAACRDRGVVLVRRRRRSAGTAAGGGAATPAGTAATGARDRSPAAAGGRGARPPRALHRVSQRRACACGALGAAGSAPTGSRLSATVVCCSNGGGVVVRTGRVAGSGALTTGSGAGRGSVPRHGKRGCAEETPRRPTLASWSPWGRAPITEEVSSIHPVAGVR